MSIRWTQSCIIVLLLAATTGLSTLLPEYQDLQCKVIFLVDHSVAPPDWTQQYAENGSTFDDTLIRNFSSFQQALLSLNSTMFNNVTNSSCVDVLVSEGTYTVTSEIVVRQNVRIRAKDSERVFVNFSISMPSNPGRVFDVITFIESDFVILQGIHFFNSSGIITIERVGYVHVSHCHFKLFDRGAVEVYTCSRTVFYNCTFEENGLAGVVKEDKFRGHAGGLSVDYVGEGIDMPSSPSLIISNCVFRNNTSLPAGKEKFPFNHLIQENRYFGRGGALAININSIFPYNTLIQDCTIENNSARLFGGGLYLVLRGVANHSTVINASTFRNNQCKECLGGGIHVRFMKRQYFFVSGLLIESSVFENNAAAYGGGVNIFTSLRSVQGDTGPRSFSPNVNNCTFTGNTAVEFGAAISVSSLILLTDTSQIQPFTFKDCSFFKNQGGRGNAGTMSIAYLPLSFYGNNIFDSNEGYGLLLSGTRADIHGSLVFSENRRSKEIIGVAIFVTSFSQLKLFKGATILLNNNSGTIGASLVVRRQYILSKSYSQIEYNPLCALQYEERDKPPNEWENVSIQFSNNRATYGSSVLIDNIDLCSWTGSTVFNRNEVFRWNFVHHSNNSVNSAHAPYEHDPKWYVQTQAQKIFNEGKNIIVAYPGQTILLNLTGIDELGLPVSHTSHLFHDTFLFSPSAAGPAAIENDSISTNFYMTTSNEADIANYGPTNLTINTILADEVSPIQVTLVPKECPVGFGLVHKENSNAFYKCDCNEDNNRFITECDRETIILNSQKWASVHHSAPNKLFVHQCPHTYCQCLSIDPDGEVECKFRFNSTNPDQQCHCKRQGILCGSCRNESDGFTVLLNQCASCGYENMLYLVALVIADAIVITVLLSLSFSPPGWLYPTLFYLQMVPYLTTYFPATFEVFRPIIFYVSSALGLYFAYDFCLGPSIPAVGVYFVRFVPFVISLIISSIVLFIRYLCGLKKKPWPGLWWVVLLQFSHLAHTCISVFDCPQIPGKDQVFQPRWSVNGDTTCFEGAHIALTMLSLVVLLFSILLIVTIFLFNAGKFQKPYWLASAVQPMTAAFKPMCQCWGAMELVRRLLLLTMVIAFPGNYFPIIFTMMFSIGVCLFLQPFKSIYVNLIEAFLAASVLLLLELPNVDFDSSFQTTFYTFNGSIVDQCIGGVNVITQGSIFITLLYFVPLVTFIVTVIISGALLVRSRYCLKKIESKEPESDYKSDYRRASGDSPVSATSIALSEHLTPLSEIIEEVFSRRRLRRKKSRVEKYEDGSHSNSTLPNRPSIKIAHPITKPRSNTTFIEGDNTNSIDAFEQIELQLMGY